MATGRVLLFDIGNTRVKWGVLDQGELKRFARLTEGHQTIGAQDIAQLGSAEDVGAPSAGDDVL